MDTCDMFDYFVWFDTKEYCWCFYNKEYGKIMHYEYKDEAYRAFEKYMEDSVK